jgi:hypothetical protein
VPHVRSSGCPSIAVRMRAGSNRQRLLYSLTCISPSLGLCGCFPPWSTLELHTAPILSLVVNQPTIPISLDHISAIIRSIWLNYDAESFNFGSASFLTIICNAGAAARLLSKRLIRELYSAFPTSPQALSLTCSPSPSLNTYLPCQISFSQKRRFSTALSNRAPPIRYTLPPILRRNISSAR